MFKKWFGSSLLLVLTGLGLLLVNPNWLQTSPTGAVFGKETGSNFIENDNLRIIKEIINYGALAPSSHNAQMWQVKIVSVHEIIVMLDQERTLPQVDPLNRESLISLGGFIENMVAAAPQYNLEADVRILTQKPTDTEIAAVTFKTKTMGDSSDEVIANIKNRHTIRIPYLKKELTEQDLNRLKAISQNISYFPLNSNAGQYLKTAIIQATKQQVADDAKQMELAGLMRFSKKDAAAKKDGLTPEMMGLSGIAKWFVTTFFNQNTVLSKSFREQTVATVKKQAENCAGFIMISSPDQSVESLVNSGRTLEKLLLKATGLKIAVHPLSAPLEESPWQEEIAGKIGVNQEVQMLLRVGYVKDYGKPVSKRRAVTIIQP